MGLTCSFRDNEPSVAPGSAQWGRLDIGGRADGLGVFVPVAVGVVWARAIEGGLGPLSSSTSVGYAQRLAPSSAVRGCPHWMKSSKGSAQWS